MQKNSLILFCLGWFLVLPETSMARSTFMQNVIEQNKQLSKRFDELAREVDTLLSSRQSPKRNPSQIQLISNTTWNEGGDVRTLPQFALDLRLPAVEKKWQLRFSSYDREDQFEGLERNRDGSVPQNRKAGASVGLLRKVGNLNFFFRPRIEFRDPLVTGFLMRVDQTIAFNKIYYAQWTQKLFAHSEEGAGLATELDFNAKVSSLLLFRWFNEMQYLDFDNYYEVSQGPSLIWRLSEAYALSHTVSFNSENRNRDIDNRVWNSYHLKSITLYTSFGHRILNKVLHYQITPFLNFPKQYNFKGQAGVNFRLALIF